jgi:hypothetical protein
MPFDEDADSDYHTLWQEFDRARLEVLEAERKLFERPDNDVATRERVEAARRRRDDAHRALHERAALLQLFTPTLGRP